MPNMLKYGVFMAKNGSVLANQAHVSIAAGYSDSGCNHAA